MLALADRSDAWHRKARTFLSSTDDTLLIPVTVLPEVAYLLHERIGPASVVAMAERLKLTSIATTDRRHFGAVRPKHAERFTLVP
ncbi:MAG: hypothetical protein DMF88_14160 [Acidobacteria bacterium]|nr:MAG: hypothetical protein DMF88_14160 [Acidobacteriota bacterium]